MQRSKKLEELTELIDRFDTAMLVTISGEGLPHARPMAIAGRDRPLSMLYFVTDEGSPKVDELSANPTGLVALQQATRFVSLAGEVTVEPVSRNDIGSLWQPQWRVWFSDDEASAGLGLLRFRIERAEYWDRSGANRWRFLWETGKALGREESLDDQSLAGHAKLDFGSGTG